MKLLRRLLLAIGIIFILLGLCLLFGGLLCIGANDGEWAVLSRTGKPSTPDLITWSEWKPNDRDLVHALRAYQAAEHKPHFNEYRVGIAKSFPFTFTFYEGHSTSQPEAGHFPALGPDWGAVYNYYLPLFTILSGIALLIIRRFIRYKDASSDAVDSCPQLSASS